MEHLSNIQFKLKNRSEIKELLDVPGFYEYAMPVYNYLETMKPGKVIKLIASEDRIEWLIKTVCLFIASGEHWREYELNADYTKIRRIVIPEKWKHRYKRFDIKKP